MRFRIKKGDMVVVTTGKSKGKKGEVLQVLRDKERVVVKGANVVVRHQKPSQENPKGGIVRREASVHVSNVAHVDPKDGGVTRVGMKTLENGKRVRYAKKSGAEIG